MTNKLKLVSNSKNFIKFDNGLIFIPLTGELTFNKSQTNMKNWKINNKFTLIDEYKEKLPFLQLSLTTHCNLRCKYCSFREREKLNNKPKTQDEKIIKKAINFYFDYLKNINYDYARIDFGVSGEPYLAKNKFDFVFKQIEENFLKLNFKKIFVGPYITNALFDEPNKVSEIISLPQDISCDGPELVHDSMRVDANNKGTYKKLFKVIKKVLKRNPNIGVSTVLTANCTQFDKILFHLHDTLGFNCIYMKPVNVPPNVDYGLNLKTLDQFKKGYTNMINFILSQNDEKLLEYLLSLNSEDFFMRFFYRIKNRSRQLFRCGAGKTGVYTDTDGKLYPCSHFLGKIGYDIGDLDSGFNKKRLIFIEQNVNDRKPCKECWARYLCGGGCYYQSVLANNDITMPDKAKCELIKHLCMEAIRLLLFLHTYKPNILNALPDDYYIDEKYLNSTVNVKYLPTCTLSVNSRKEAINFSTNLKMSLNSVNNLIVKIQKSNEQLTITFDKDVVEKNDIVFSFIKTKNFRILDLMNYNIDLVDIQYKLTNKNKIYKKYINNVYHKIPLKNSTWKICEKPTVSVLGDKIKINFDLRYIFKNSKPDFFGFNIRVNFPSKAYADLISHEPFCLINWSENGNLYLNYNKHERLTKSSTDCLNGYKFKNMCTLSNYTGIKVNVC